MIRYLFPRSGPTPNESLSVASGVAERISPFTGLREGIDAGS